MTKINTAGRFLVATSALLVSLAFTPAQAADEYYFYVQNKTDSRITKLQVSEDKKTWGYFDIGKGIPPGKKVKLTWDSSSDDEECKQWVKAVFADGSTSELTKMDFCEDLDTPIVFD